MGNSRPKCSKLSSSAKHGKEVESRKNHSVRSAIAEAEASYGVHAMNHSRSLPGWGQMIVKGSVTESKDMVIQELPEWEDENRINGMMKI